METKDAKEGISAFMEKRKPVWKDECSSGTMIFTPEEEIETGSISSGRSWKRASLDGAFFHYKIDYYYFSGTMQDALLFVPAGGDPVSLSRGR